MDKQRVTEIRKAAIMFAFGYSYDEIVAASSGGVSLRTLQRWSQGFIWNEALDFIGYTGVREFRMVRTGFGEWVDSREVQGDPRCLPEPPDPEGDSK